MVIAPDHVLALVEDHMCVPWDWASSHCATAACDVFAALHGFDPMAAQRVQFQTALAWRRITKRAGGMIAFCHGVMERQGFTYGHAGRPGDLGLSLAGRDGFDTSVVICVAPDIWAGKTEQGFMIVENALGYRCPS